MATKTREYIIKVPFTISQWRKGQRYVLAKYTTDEVQIVKTIQKKEGEKLITETHKILNIAKRLPGIIKNVISNKSLLIDEYSLNIDEIIYEDKDNKDVMVTNKELGELDGLLENMSITSFRELKNHRDIEEALKGNNFEDGKIKKINLKTRDNHCDTQEDMNQVNKNQDNKTQMDKNQEDKTQMDKIQDNKNQMNKNLLKEESSNNDYSVVSSSCETSYHSKYYDVNTFTLTVKTKVTDEYKENIFGEKNVKTSFIDLSNGSTTTTNVYKLVHVTVNSVMMGWVCEQVKNMMKSMLIKFQNKMIETYDDWKDISEEELVELEKKMIETFMKVE